MEMKYRGPAEIFGLIKDPAKKPEFWKKAIDTLLDNGAWKINGSSDVFGIDRGNYFFPSLDNPNSVSWVQELTEEQALYAASQLPIYAEKNQQEKWAFFYTPVLLDLLPNLPEEQAETLFKHFDLTTTGFMVLFGIKDNYDVWKRKAVEMIHGRIEKEKSGDPSKSDSLLFYEGVLNYFSHVEGSLNTKLPSALRMRQQWYPPQGEKEDPDSDDAKNRFLAQEIAYVMGVDLSANRPIIRNAYRVDLSAIYDHLEGDARLNFAKRQVLGLDADGRGFRLWSESAIVFAQKVVQEFPNEEVSKRLKRMLSAEKGSGKRMKNYWTRRRQLEEEKEKIAKAEEQVIVNLMNEP